MIVDVYDLTGALCYSRYDVNVELCTYNLISKRRRICDVLIYPDSRNQPPYIQDTREPFLGDLIGADGKLTYERCRFLSDFFQMETLNDKHELQKDDLIGAFLQALQVSRYVDKTKVAERNVILIPDNFDAVMQEKILRMCGLPRDKTCLLWRSVAACLGNSSSLMGADNVTVVDVQQSYIDVSELKIVEEDGVRIPQRKAYKYEPGRGAYPYHVRFDGSFVFEPNNSFYRHTFYGKTGQRVVWDHESAAFRTLEFAQVSKMLRLHFKLFGNVLVIGHSGINLNHLSEFIRDKNGVSVSNGAALYIARKESNRPTYFDECTGLYIVVQDAQNETIFSKELIAPNERCKGGAVVEGVMNDDCFIEAGADNSRFRLVESSGDDVPLKVLDYRFFGGAMKEREPLRLYPSMIPGQGIARVRVEGAKQLGVPVYLDLLEMTYPSPQETVKSLREKIKHSYPVSLPAVVADGKLWSDVFDMVRRYMNNSLHRDKDMFNKLRYVNPNAEGLERLSRKNVFGYADNREYPASSLRFDFDELFRYMADDYARCKHRRNQEDINDILAMISRTYQGHCQHFRNVKKDLLCEVESCANGYTKTVNTHVMTACAYLLRSPDELSQYLKCYRKMLITKLDGRCLTGLLSLSRIPSFSGLLHWHRVFYELMLVNSEMPKLIHTTDCNTIADALVAMLISHNVHRNPDLACAVLKAFLYLLRRRKYDKSFLCSGSELRAYIEEALQKVISGKKANSTVRLWSEIVLKFVQGNGSLTDIVSIIES